MNEEQEQIEIEKRFKEKLDKITSFLNEFEKDYELRYWDGLNGADITISEIEFLSDNTEREYKIVLSLSENGILTFEEEKDET